MDTELRAVKAALADISDNELQALIDATRAGTQTAQGLRQERRDCRRRIGLSLIGNNMHCALDTACREDKGKALPK